MILLTVIIDNNARNAAPNAVTILKKKPIPVECNKTNARVY